MLGERSWLYSSFAFVHYQSSATPGVRIGHDTGVYHGSFFDLGPNAQVEIGNYCSLVGVIFATNGRIAIGDCTFMAHEVVIADDPWTLPVSSAKQLTPSAATQNGSRVTIGKNVWIGAQSVIVGAVQIGDDTVIGAGSVITADVPAGVVCAGNPMRIIRSLH